MPADHLPRYCPWCWLWWRPPKPPWPKLPCLNPPSLEPPWRWGSALLVKIRWAWGSSVSGSIISRTSSSVDFSCSVLSSLSDDRLPRYCPWCWLWWRPPKPPWPKLPCPKPPWRCGLCGSAEHWANATARIASIWNVKSYRFKNSFQNTTEIKMQNQLENQSRLLSS